MTHEIRQCKKCRSSFVIEPDDFVFYAKFDVPPPELCSDCRLQLRMAFRNFKTLYKRKSDRSLKSLISMYSPRSSYKIYSHEEWWSDDWDATLFGREFDFNRPFFDQFHELLLSVPRFNLMNTASVNCEYSNFTYGSKNCYLVFGCVDDEECAYGHIVWESKDSLDNLYLYKSELCYECVDCLNSYKLLYCQECESCSDSIGLFDCRGCSNCIGCAGLNQKNYYIFNEFAGKEKYEEFLSKNIISEKSTIDLILGKKDEIKKQVPQRSFFGFHNSNVSGNHIYNSKNIHNSFDVKKGEDSKYIYTGRNAVDSYDLSFSVDFERAYFCLTAKGKDLCFCHLTLQCNDAYYSDSCFNSHFIFGCVGLKGNEHCILNKQYTKEGYEAMRERIVEHMKKTGEWGHFFPAKLSPFGYNESIAQEYTPLSRSQALEQGFLWNNEMPDIRGQATIAYNQLPKNPADFDEKLVNYILKCELCDGNYRLIPKEIDFYKKMNLSLPGECFNCRHARRMALRYARKLWKGNCAFCGGNFETAYNPDQQKEFKIYCETCYNAEVV